MSQVAVVGGGVSGIAAAWYLAKDGHDVEIIEQGPQLGGRVASQNLGHRLVTLGGKNIGRRYRRFREFVADHGEHSFEPFGVNWTREVNGRLLTLDSTRRRATARNLLRQATPRDVARFGRWMRAVKRDEENRFLRGPYWATLGERKDHRPLASYVSPRLRQTMIRMMTVRLNGAEPDEVYLGTFGSNLGMMDTFEQLTHGLEPILDAFAQRHSVRLGTRVERLLTRDGRVRGLELATSHGVEERDYDAVVVALPALHAAPLLRPLAPNLADRLASVRYFPASTLVVEYERDVFASEIRAIAFDERSPLSNAGAYGIRDLRTVRYTFSGRAARELVLVHGDDLERLADIGERQLEPHFPVSGAGRRALVGTRWNPSYCAFVPRHGSFLDAVDRDVAAIPGLHLTGDYFRGASIEACFKAAEDCVTSARDRLRRTAGPPALMRQPVRASGRPT